MIMSIFFPNRALHLRERMDDPACDLQRLNNTYKHFYIVNQVLSGWRRVYKHHLRQYLGSGATLLDIGCGGGDVLRQLALWTRQDGLKVQFTGIDPDVRALEYARSRPVPHNVKLYQASSADLLCAGQKFDVVISNHVLHHLQDDEVYVLCKDSEQLAKKIVIHNDLRRSSLAYINYAATQLLFWNSYVTRDGLCSIRRSFTASELQSVVPQHWHVEPMIPFRNLLIYKVK
jgi:2-polyprenyl-3-methyl-5-hydroxy-6-metoxy-1,4-benzoquinol methylase